MWTVALISPVTFSEVRLRSAADSNMSAAAAVARVHVLARPSVWQVDDFDVLNMSFTQKRPEIVWNTCAAIAKLDSNILFHDAGNCLKDLTITSAQIEKNFHAKKKKIK